MIRTVNLISGGGSTNLAVLEEQKSGGKLFGLVETVAIVSSDPQATGVKKALDFGFSSAYIHIVSSGDSLAGELLTILDRYQPDYFHQLGWMPKTPPEVLDRYKGLNQHLGPGGKWMYGVRRVYAHIRSCQMMGERRPIPIFCQRVESQYDEGDVIFLQYEEILPGETAEEAAERLLPIEHQVQIEALRRLATDQVKDQPVPNLAQNQAEEVFLEMAKKESRQKYPKNKEGK